MAWPASLPPWPLLAEFLRTLVVPTLAVSGAVLTVVCCLTRSEPIRTVGAAVALLAGLLAGNHFHPLVDWWPTPFMRGWRSLFPAVSAVIVLTTLLAIKPAGRHWAIGPGVRLLVAAASASFLLEPLAPLTSGTTFILLLAGIVINGEISRFAFSFLPRHGTLPVLAVLWGGAAATLLIFAHSARFSDLAALFTISLSGVGLVAVVWKQDISFLLPAPCVFFPGLLLAGAANTFSEVPIAAFACVAFAPCALFPGFFPQFQRLPVKTRITLAVVSLLVPCVAGIAMAVRYESLDFG